MSKYRIIEAHNVPELAKLEKSDIKVEITLGETLQALEYNKKGIEKIEAEVGLKKAILKNVSENYPEVLNLDEKMLIAAHTYLEASKYIKIAEEKLAEFKKAQDELNQEVIDIKEQTGLEKTSAEENARIMKEIQDSIKIVDENGNPLTK